MAYSHVRLRKFNTAKTYPEQKLDNDLSMSVRAGNFVFLRGQVGQALDGSNVGTGDAAAQTEQAMKNIKQLLEEQGARLGDICKLVIYLTDPRYREAVYRVVGKWLKGVYPVSTGLVIQALARPEWVVEVDVIAVIPDSRLKSIPAPDEDLQWKDTADRKDAKSKAKRKKKKMTFSIAGRCSRTGMFGVAITTSSIAVAARCPWVRSGVGAISTQNVTDPRLGPKGLDLLQQGLSAPEAMAQLIAHAPNPEYRQVIMVDAAGRTAHWTGEKALGTRGVAEGKDCVSGGNLLKHPDVPQAIVAGFAANSEAALPDRLIAALEAGLASGGEMGPVHSAGVIVVHDQVWPLVDLRVDWADDNPIAGLRKLWEAYRPQMNDYVTRALNPSAAPSYGVPGDPGR